MPSPSNAGSLISLQRSDPIDLGGRRIFLTGGTGFVGRTLLDYFDESAQMHGDRFQVTVMSRSPLEFLRRWPAYGEARWLDIVKGALDAMPAPVGTYTDMIHAAADTHRTDDRTGWIDEIIGGTRTALDWAVTAGAGRFLLTSSGAVYGPQPAGLPRIPEGYGGAPSTTTLHGIYGQAKRVAEQLCTIYTADRKIDAVIARCFAFVGPHLQLDGHYAIGNFIQDALDVRPIQVSGDGTAVRSYLYGRDMAHWLVRLLLSGEPGEAYNVGADEGLPLSEVARFVETTLIPGHGVRIENQSGADSARSVYVPSIAKAQRLGLAVETPLREAIELTARHARRRRDAGGTGDRQ